MPPLTSWISFIIRLLGNGVFWVKFFPALFGAITLVVVWKTITELNGSLTALLIGATGVLFSALLRLNTLYQPNSLDVLCWATLSYLLIKYLHTENPRWLYGCAIVFAVGFLNKYNIVFLVFGLLPAIMLTPQRKLFLKRELYLALGLVFLLILPNLIWQYQNNFPVVHHLNQLTRLQLAHVDRFDFLKNQILFFFGALPVILLGLFALIAHEPFKRYQAFFWSILFTLGLFLWLRAKDYYAIGLYPVYIAFGATFIQHISHAGWRRALIAVALVLPIGVFIGMYQVIFPNKTPAYILEHQAQYKALGMFRWEDGADHALPQDFADMLGWRELAEKVDQAYTEINEPETTLVLCDNYGQAGAINYYSRVGVRAVTFNADYLDWFEMDTPYQNVIRIKERAERNAEMQETAPHFKISTIADSIANVHAREFGTTIFVFQDALVNVNERIAAEIQENKANR